MASESFTKLYFVIFAAVKESVTLNLAQRSFKVIDFGRNRKSVYDFVTLYRPLTVTFALSSTVSEILPVLYVRSQFSACTRTPLLFRLNLGAFRLEEIMMLRSAGEERLG